MLFIDLDFLNKIDPKNFVYKEIQFTKIISTDKKAIFCSISDVSRYSSLPMENPPIFKILNQTETRIIGEETITQIGITAKFFVSYDLEKYEKLTISVLDGDLKDSSISIMFEEFGDETKISVKTSIKAIGATLLPEDRIRGLMENLLEVFESNAINNPQNSC